MPLKKLNILVVGATGYVGLDLIYLLSKHPKVKINYLCAQKNIGKSISRFDIRIKKKLPKISKLKKVNKNIIFDELIQKYTQKDDDTLTRFLLYRDLRTKGYVVKDGFGFDSDFRVYEKGNYGKKDAKFLIFAFNEGTQQKIGKLYKNIQEITQMGKEPIIAVIERRGEIIYYKINKMNFLENQSELEMKDFNFN